jgi:hypothetical protein
LSTAPAREIGPGYDKTVTGEVSTTPASPDKACWTPAAVTADTLTLLVPMTQTGLPQRVMAALMKIFVLPPVYRAQLEDEATLDALASVRYQRRFSPPAETGRPRSDQKFRSSSARVPVESRLSSPVAPPSGLR